MFYIIIIYVLMLLLYKQLTR